MDKVVFSWWNGKLSCTKSKLFVIDEGCKNVHYITREIWHSLHTHVLSISSNYHIFKLVVSHCTNSTLICLHDAATLLRQ